MHHMQEYLTEAAEIAATSQYRLELIARQQGVDVRGRSKFGGVIRQLVPYAAIDKAIINPVAIAIQMIEQELEMVTQLEDEVCRAYQ